jgi:hypothetical protein
MNDATATDDALADAAALLADAEHATADDALAATDDAARSARIAAAELRMAAAAARTAELTAEYAAERASTDDATLNRRAARRARLAANDANATPPTPPTADDTANRFTLIGREDNAALIHSVATHAAAHRYAGNTAANDIAQSLAIELATADIGTAAATAAALLALPHDDANRALLRTRLQNIAKNYARVDTAKAMRERASGIVTMASFNDTQRDAYDAALAADSRAERTDKDNAHKINGALLFAAAMGNAAATARTPNYEHRMANASLVKRTREVTNAHGRAAGNKLYSNGYVRIVREQTLENMLTHAMSVGGMLIGGVHGGGTADADDALAMRRWRETFMSAPPPVINGNAMSKALAAAIDRLSTREVKAFAALAYAAAPPTNAAARSALHALATGQITTLGALIAACVRTSRLRTPKGAQRINELRSYQIDTDAALADDAEHAPSTIESSRVDYTLALRLLGYDAKDSTARRTLKAMAVTLATDSGALHNAANCRRGVVTAERIASPNTRGGMQPVYRHDALAAYRKDMRNPDDATPWRFSVTAAPPTLRIARHAAVADDADAWRADDAADNAVIPWRGAPPAKDMNGNKARPIWSDTADAEHYADADAKAVAAAAEHAKALAAAVAAAAANRTPNNCGVRRLRTTD